MADIKNENEMELNDEELNEVSGGTGSLLTPKKAPHPFMSDKIPEKLPVSGVSHTPVVKPAPAPKTVTK